jgi:hypothetical protein
MKQGIEKSEKVHYGVRAGIISCIVDLVAHQMRTQIRSESENAFDVVDEKLSGLMRYTMTREKQMRKL